MDIEDVSNTVKSVEGALDPHVGIGIQTTNKFCDKGDVKGMTKRINGGYIDLEDRTTHWVLHYKFFGGEVLVIFLQT